MVLLSTEAGTVNIPTVMTPVRMFVFSLVIILYIPCVATVAALMNLLLPDSLLFIERGPQSYCYSISIRQPMTMAVDPVAPVPFYHQRYDFTCGPASLIMAMKHYDPELAPNRELEIDIWREANLIEAYATSHYGLALAAHRRGFICRTQGNARADRLLDCLCRSCRIRMDKTSKTVECGLVERPVRILDHRLCLLLHPENRYFALALLHDLQKRCGRAGIPNRDRPVSVPVIRQWLGKGWLPIVLMDARIVGDAEVPHWLLVTRIGKTSITFHDPLARTGDSTLPVGKFGKFLGFHGTNCAVIVEGKAHGTR